MPKYKAIKGMILTEEPLIKTTTNKIKRQANLERIETKGWKINCTLERNEIKKWK